jgi:hypothetical protein
VEVDLCEIALLKDLAELDEIGDTDPDLRNALLVSALDSALMLAAQGGGSLADKLDAITSSLKAELGQ